MCQGPNREGGSGHQKKNEDENEDGKWGMWVLFMSCFVFLFHSLSSSCFSIFTYLFFCASDQRMLLLVAVVGCAFALQLKRYLTYTACTRGAVRLDSGLLQMDCSCFAGDKRRWPIRLNPTEPMQRREKRERVGWREQYRSNNNSRAQGDGGGASRLL